jgi:hypothetical protein
VLGGVGGDGLMRFVLLTIIFSFLLGCDNHKNFEDENNAFVAHVNEHKIDSDTDYWIEMLNMSGQWEKTVLVFGYTDDFGECKIVAEGLKKVNFAREYRCSPANQK